MRALSSRQSKQGNSSGGDSAPRPPRDVSGVRYDVLDRVGEGTLWVVYRVRERSNNRLLALKALKNNFNAHPQFAPALAQAVADSARFSHPLLAQIEEVGREDGTLFLLQEWLSGQSLEARLRRAPFGRIESLTSARQIAEALSYLHENQSVHGDLRPRQIMSSGEGNLKLCDFGLSVSFRAAGLSSTDVLQDAVAYAAPELGAATGGQAESATPASDMYALGVILYRMLAGRAPFEGPSPVAVAMRHRNDAPLPPSRFNPHCAPDLETLALQLLQKNPASRPDAAAVLQTLGATSPIKIASPIAENAVVPETDAAQPESMSALVANSETPDNKTQPLPASPYPTENAAIVNAATENAATPNTQAPDAQTFGAQTPGATVSSDAILADENSAMSASALSASAAPSSTRYSPDLADAVPNAALFPAAMSISAIANVPLATVSTAAVSATNAMAIPAAAIGTTAIGATAIPTTAIGAANVGAASVSGRPVLPPTAEDLAADAAEERKSIKKHRWREAWGAAFALLWIVVAVLGTGQAVVSSYNWWLRQTPPDVAVPSYIGKNEVQAKALLEKSGLKYSQLGEVYDPKRAAGTVIRGFPAAGKRVKPGRTIDITVSRGAEKVVMPDLSELDLVRVREILQKAGMRLGNISTMYHDTVARGYICGQYPQPGDAFSRSEPINLVISRGAQPPVVAPKTAPAKTKTAVQNDVSPADSIPTDSVPTDSVSNNPDIDNSAPTNPPISGANNGGANNDVTSSGNSNDNAAMAPAGLPALGTAPIVSRTVRLNIPVPAKSGASSRQVRVVVSDAGGQNTVYEQDHAPGEQVEEYVEITRAQGGSATIFIYIDGQLQKQQRV